MSLCMVTELHCLKNAIVNENKINIVQNFQMHSIVRSYFITNIVAMNYLNQFLMIWVVHNMCNKLKSR